MLKIVALLMLCYGITNVCGSNYDDTIAKMKPEERVIVVKMREQCLAETGVNIKVIEDSYLGKFDPAGNLQVYMVCVWKLLGALDDDFVFEPEVIIDLTFDDILKDYFRKGFDKCYDSTARTEDAFLKVAYNLMKCFYELDPTKFVYP